MTDTERCQLIRNLHSIRDILMRLPMDDSMLAVFDYLYRIENAVSTEEDLP